MKCNVRCQSIFKNMFIWNKWALFIAHLCSIFPKGWHYCFLDILSLVFSMIVTLEGWQFVPLPQPPHLFHTHVDDQILMESDFIMNFQPLSSRDSSVWKSGCKSKMSPKMKKGTFGFRNRRDLLKRTTGLDWFTRIHLLSLFGAGGTVTPFRVSLASPGSSAGLPGFLGYSEFLTLSACLYEQSRPSTNACRMNEWMRKEWLQGFRAAS